MVFYCFGEWILLIIIGEYCSLTNFILFFQQICEPDEDSFWTISVNWLTKIDKKLFWWVY